MGAYEGTVAPTDIVTLTVGATPENSCASTPPAGVFGYIRGEVARVAVQPVGMSLDHWSGDASGNDTVIELEMSSSREIQAHLADNVIRVDSSSEASAPDGQTWANAYRDLQSAVDAADAVHGGEIWVAAGVYTAVLADSVLCMKQGVCMYGGFAGAETARDERDWYANVTTIDGEGVRRCVTGADKVVLDGFTMTRGFAHEGGGMLNDWTSSPTIRNCVFSDNTGQDSGGGMANGGTVFEMENCQFLRNWARSGAGVSNVTSSVLFRNCIFSANTTVNNGDGGGMYNRASSPMLVNCVFSENSGNEGGAIFNGGLSLPTIFNCTFAENDANDATIYNADGSWATITNSIMWNTSGGDRMIQDASLPGSVITYSCIREYDSGIGNISSDPLFQNAPDDLRLQPGSPCIDTATAEGAPVADIDGVLRSRETGIDMGSYEYFVLLPEGEPLEGETPEGELLEGEIIPEGALPEGGIIEGEIRPEGTIPEGESVLEGISPDGEAPVEGSLPEGEPVIEGLSPDGEVPAEGLEPEGSLPEGEPVIEGETPEGSPTEGEFSPEGQMPEGSSVEGQHTEGESPEGDHSEGAREGEPTDGDTEGAAMEGQDMPVEGQSARVTGGCFARS
jgi:hypothetical protein